ncbi:MAG: DUF3592 domain-containing protein [Anaerolineae bacterium]|nr:DUF3592 domain-containing protein [Anaerolineae bacterium]
MLTTSELPEQLFLLREDHWEYLQGEQSTLPDGRLTQRERHILLGFIVVTFLITCAAIYFSYISLRLTAEGISTEADIIEHGTLSRGIPGLRDYVIYRYTVGNQTYTNQVSVTPAVARRLSRRGATATIVYLPDNPALSRLAGDNELYVETSVSIFLVLVGIGLCLLMFVRPYRVRRLAREGRVLLGEIKTSRRIYGVTHIRFTFLSPEGRRLDGVGSTKRMTAAPRPGVPVAVLYSNENYYRML